MGSGPSGFHVFFVEKWLVTPLKCLENGFISRHGDLLRVRPLKIAKIQRSGLIGVQAFAMPGKNGADTFFGCCIYGQNPRYPLASFSSLPIIPGNFMYDTFLVPPLSAGNSTPVRSYTFKVKMDKAGHGGGLRERLRL
jgi:hypothetical protein